MERFISPSRSAGRYDRIVLAVIFGALAVVVLVLVLDYQRLKTACEQKYGQDWNLSYNYTKLCTNPNTGEVRRP